MVCQRGGFIIQRHNELRDLEAEMLRMVCNDVEEPVLQEVTAEALNHGANKAPDACLYIHARGFFAVCLRGSRSRRRQLDFVDSDLQIENIFWILEADSFYWNEMF